MVKTRGLACFV